MATSISTASSSATKVLGSRLLREISAEEGTLEDILKDLRTAAAAAQGPAQQQALRTRTGIPELDDLCRQHHGGWAKLSITGRGLPLLYHIINQLITRVCGTVAVVDVDGRFSPSHLSCELRHVHVFRPVRSNLRVTLESVEGYMLWGDHASKGREWVGTLVNGGVGGDVMVGWRGWLRGERVPTEMFALGITAEEARVDRERRQDVVDQSGWRAVGEMGEFSWR